MSGKTSRLFRRHRTQRWLPTRCWRRRAERGSERGRCDGIRSPSGSSRYFERRRLTGTRRSSAKLWVCLRRLGEVRSPETPVQKNKMELKSKKRTGWVLINASIDSVQTPTIHNRVRFVKNSKLYRPALTGLRQLAGGSTGASYSLMHFEWQ